MRLVFAGTPEPAVPALRALLDHPRHEVVAVITRPDAPTGRGRTLRPSPIAVVAEEAGIELLKPSSATDPELHERLQHLAPEAIPVVAYGNLIPPALLDLPTYGWINLHFSLLPAWRGAAPVNAAIAAGDEITGATTFRLEKGLDTGPILGTVTEPIGPRDTAGDLLERLANSGAHLLAATMDGLEDGIISPVAQPDHGVSHVGKIGVDDARITWTHPALAIDRHIRSVTPAPGAWTTLEGQRLRIGAARHPEGEVADLPPGQLHWNRTALYIGTGTRPLQVERLQPPGKKMMNAMDWIRGARLVEPVVLE